DFGYVVSQKGRILLLKDRYYYVREKCVHHKTYWRCTQYTTASKCHGRVHTVAGKIVHSSTHNHKPAAQERKQTIQIINLE
ncbi:hypothetical protein KR018_011335, partial [Drosophila ironensis]